MVDGHANLHLPKRTAKNYSAWALSHAITDSSRPGVGKLRPAGRMRPERSFYAARRHLQKLHLLFWLNTLHDKIFVKLSCRYPTLLLERVPFSPVRLMQAVMVFIRSGRSRPPSKNLAKQPLLKNAAKHLPQWFLTREGSTKSFKGFGGRYLIFWHIMNKKDQKKKKKRSKAYNIMNTVKEQNIIQPKTQKKKKKVKDVKIHK